MPLSDEQRTALAAEAAKEGVDPAKLIAAAERLADGASAPGTPGEGGGAQHGKQHDEQKLYMYLLPFVRVREVRSKWLGLTESFPGDNDVAAEWAMKHGGSLAGSPPGGNPDQGG